jgi:hypothetical protein
LRPEAVRQAIPEQAHVVDYALDATLSTDEHTIEGSARITWRNRTSHATDQLPMHLYMNAFRAEDTAWMSEGRGSHRGALQGKEQPWGYCDVTRVEQVLPSAGALTWSEGEDPSVMTIQLPAPVEPGETITLELDFITRLPEVFARTGFAGDFYMVGQWFPKVGVLEPDGRWKAHVFTFHSEFYADFGNYDVRLDVPRTMVVGATGIETEAWEEGDRKHLTYRAQMVHDFAWTAWPGFVEVDTEYEGIRIRQLLPREHVADAPEHARMQIAALQSMQERFGPYPWSTITIVHPPPEARGAMGMEYPTLFTTDPITPMPAPLRALGVQERLSGRLTTVHEFGHQYFQGLLASDEHSAPWLDEGMNTFSNALVAIDTWGEDPWLVRVGGHGLTLSDLIRLSLARVPPLQHVDQPATAFSPVEGLYGIVVYQRTAALMLTLRELVGAPAFDAALRTYAERYRFRHPTGDDLERVLLEGLGEHATVDVADVLEQGLRSPATVDFAVGRVANLALPGPAGWHRDESGTLVGGSSQPSRSVEGLPDDRIEGIALLQRLGEFRIPVEVEIEFHSGGARRVVWDGQARSKTLRFPGERIERVSIDPDGVLVLESVRFNNGRFAPGVHGDGGPSEALGHVAEAAALATMVGLGP